ncbi:MAG: UDP-N-acetylmuramate--L-alanine ligase [Oscillospiraceae bacterium]|nr:UDP-N-acetylmuramate--L-alanine ligase [Oscillospiraceae bacterium]
MKYNEILEGKHCLHFIGAGGSGILPLIQILAREGYSITGSDNNPGDNLEAARAAGAKIFIGHHADNIRNADLIVYSAAIMEDNPELIAAKQSGIPLLERGEFLGALSGRYKNTICIAGTHGKTTVTAMITQIMLDAGADPTAVIGGRLESIGGNGRAGKSGIMVCEACEFADTFLKLYPDISVILNIDEDHLEYFKTLDNLIASFRRFCKKTSEFLIINGDDPNVARAAGGLDKKLITFGTNENNDYYTADIRKNNKVETTFALMERGKKLTDITICIPGKHNIGNAAAACVCALRCGLSLEKIKASIQNFTGAARRFEILGKINGVTIADDYAHHPLEVQVTLNAAKELGYGRVIAVHQPFTFSRTATLLNDFAAALSIADAVALTPIMGSREKNTYGIQSADLAAKIEGCRCFETFGQAGEYALDIAKPGDLIITLGCGDIYKAAKLMLTNNPEQSY